MGIRAPGLNSRSSTDPNISPGRSNSINRAVSPDFPRDDFTFNESNWFLVLKSSSEFIHWRTRGGVFLSSEPSTSARDRSSESSSSLATVFVSSSRSNLIAGSNSSATVASATGGGVKPERQALATTTKPCTSRDFSPQYSWTIDLAIANDWLFFPLHIVVVSTGTMTPSWNSDCSVLESSMTVLAK